MTMPDCYKVDDNSQVQNRHPFCVGFNNHQHVNAYRTNYDTNIELSQQSNTNELSSLLTTSVSSSNVSSPSSSSPSSPSSSILDFNSNSAKSLSNSGNTNDYEMVSTH